MLEGAAVPSEEDIKAVREEMKAEKKKNRRGSSRRGGNRSRDPHHSVRCHSR